MSTYTVTPQLDSLENEILDKIVAGVGTPQRDATKAFAVWMSDEGRIEFGALRWAYTNNLGTRFSVSPFPGAWTDVPREAILRVSAPGALVSARTAGEIIDRHNEYQDKWCDGRGVTHRRVEA